MAASKKSSQRSILAWVGPAVMAAGFLSVFALHLVLIANRTLTKEEMSLMDAGSQAASSIGLRLQGNVDFLELLAVEASLGLSGDVSIEGRASRYLRDHPELVGVVLIDTNTAVRWAVPQEREEELEGLDYANPEVQSAVQETYETGQTVWSRPAEVMPGPAVILVSVPMSREGECVGVLLGIYGAEQILEYAVPPAIRSNYGIAMISDESEEIARVSHNDQLDPEHSCRLPLGRPGHGTALMITSRANEFPWDVAAMAGVCGVLVLSLAWGTISLRRELIERKRIEQERELLADRLRKSQRMESLGRLAGGIAHDFNNLLTAMLGNTEILLTTMGVQKGVPDEEMLHDHLEQIQFAGERAASLTRQLLAFSRQKVGTPRVLDANVVVDNMERMLQRLVGDEIDLRIQVHPRPQLVMAEPGQIEQILMNLVVNAADATNGKGKVDVRVGPQVLIENVEQNEFRSGPGKYLLITVKDNGTGIPSDVMEKMYEPFFTTKPLGKGTGLGLATVYGTVTQLGGNIEVDTKERHGTTFSVYLPVVKGEEVVNHVEDERRDMESTMETILVCEDEPLVRRVTCEALESAGYGVIETSGGQEALDRAASHDGEIDMLLTDVMMPEINGKELAEKLMGRYPKMRVLYVSGYTADVIGLLGEGSSEAGVLEKPFQQTDLLGKIRQVLDKNKVSV